MPIEQLTSSSRSSITTGCESCSITFCATCAMSEERLTSGSTTTNSSPPMRQMVSPTRSCFTRRLATSFSSASPTAWPSESLMVLKRSRSTNITAVFFWLR